MQLHALWDNVNDVETKLKDEGYEPSTMPISDDHAVISWLPPLDENVNHPNVKFSDKILMKQISFVVGNGIKSGFKYFNDSKMWSKTESKAFSDIDPRRSFSDWHLSIDSECNNSDQIVALFKNAINNGSKFKCEIKEEGKQNLNVNASPKNSEAEEWWIDQTRDLIETFNEQMTCSQDEYKLMRIDLLFNRNCTNRFMKLHDNVFDLKNVKIMFHGAKTLQSMFEQGFLLSKKGSIGKLYGNGHYLTTQAIHAIRYLKWCKTSPQGNEYNKPGHTLKILGALVNPGKIKVISDTTYCDKEIGDNYDSHFVKVSDGVFKPWKYGLGHPIDRDGRYKGFKMEEYAIKDSNRILPRFFMTVKHTNHIFIWRDKNTNNEFNSSVKKEVEKMDGKLYGATDSNTALAIGTIKLKNQANIVHFITNGAYDGKGFVEKIRTDLCLQTDILVFCGAVKWHSKWAKLFKNVYVKHGRQSILEFYKTHLQYQSNHYNNQSDRGCTCM